MKFKVMTSEWTDGLALVSTTTPKAIDAKGTSGYLCVVRGEKCFLYSEGDQQRTRVSVPIFDVEGEGAFVYPTGSQGDLRYVDGCVEFETGEEGGATIIWCRREAEEAKGPHKIITFSPNVLKSLDEDFARAKESGSYPVVLLREALNATRTFLHKEPNQQGVRPEFKSVQLFGEDTSADANGHMLGHTHNRTCYFYSPELEGQPLSVFALRIPPLLQFLSKSGGRVSVYRSANSTYFVNAEQQVLGWSNQETPMPQFGYYALALDRIVLKISRPSLEKEMRYIRSTLPKDKDKAFFKYDHKTRVVSLSADNTLGGEADSLPIGVTPLVAGDERCWSDGDLGQSQDVECNVNLDLLIQLVDGTKHPKDFILGIAQAKKTKQYLFRVVEEYFIDEGGKYVENPKEGQGGHQCRTIRYVPAKN